MLADRILDAAAQSWPPFVLVAGLLLIGAVAAEEELFAAAGATIARTSIAPIPLLFGLLALDACVTAVLNLDTAVVFLTPVLVHAARSRGLDERPFLYGSVLMANASSTLLPGSNLTNLLVLRSAGGGGFARQMLPAWLASIALTAVLLVLVLPPGRAGRPAAAPPRFRLGLGAGAAVCAGLAVLTLRHPAVPVAALGIAACSFKRLRPRLDVRTPALLFVAAIVLGTAARTWSVPLASGRWATGALAAAASIVVNNLPAAVLFSAQPPPHPIALLLGLDLGPNLAVTGSLSAMLWLQAARSVEARPSVRLYSLLGALLVPPTLAVALAVS
jgi:arsenical pump membrane protein